MRVATPESTRDDVSRLVVTTAMRPTAALVAAAGQAAEVLGAEYARRERHTLTQLASITGGGRFLIAGHKGWKLEEPKSGMSYAFHPNMVVVRGHCVLRGERELFLEATGLKPGNSLLDCTVGFAAEATLAALAVGEAGRVVGLESVPELAWVTRQGVGEFPLGNRLLREALRRVEVVHADYRHFLSAAGSASFDVVYFDPFFADRLAGSENSVGPLAYFGNRDPLDEGAIREATRVARDRVVVKHPRDIELPQSLQAGSFSHVFTRKGRIVYSVMEVAKGAAHDTDDVVSR